MDMEDETDDDDKHAKQSPAYFVEKMADLAIKTEDYTLALDCLKKLMQHYKR